MGKPKPELEPGKSRTTGYLDSHTVQGGLQFSGKAHIYSASVIPGGETEHFIVFQKAFPQTLPSFPTYTP